MTEKTTPVYLYGHLRKRFGPRFDLVINSPADALNGLCHVVPGFRDYLGEHSLPGYRVLVGNVPRDESNMHEPCTKAVKIVPAVAGAKDALGQILTGAALIAMVYFTGGSGATFLSASAGNWLSAATINVGFAMVLGGVAQMLSPQPGVGPQSPNGTDDVPSYTFGSPTVTVGQGRPYPVFYGGPLRIGGAVVSSGITSEGYQPKGFGGAAPDDAGTMGGNGDSLPWVWAIAPQG